MSEQPPIPAVFDCTLFAQALINPRGPAGEALGAAQQRRVRLFISEVVLQEIRELPDKLPVRLRVTSERVEGLIADLAKYAEPVQDVPQDFQYPRDPDDAHYVNLAICTGALLVVSRDRDLLDLMKDENEQGRELRARYPSFNVVSPPGFLAILNPQET